MRTKLELLISLRFDPSHLMIISGKSLHQHFLGGKLKLDNTLISSQQQMMKIAHIFFRTGQKWPMFLVQVTMKDIWKIGPLC